MAANDYIFLTGVVQHRGFATAVNSHQGLGHYNVMGSYTLRDLADVFKTVNQSRLAVQASTNPPPQVWRGL